MSPSNFVFPSSIDITTVLSYTKYAAAFLAVFLTAGITFWLVRKIADIIIGSVLIGAFLVIGYELKSGSIVSWGEVIGASVGIGAIASMLCIPMLPFSSITPSSASSKKQSPQSKDLAQSTPLGDPQEIVSQ